MRAECVRARAVGSHPLRRALPSACAMLRSVIKSEPFGLHRPQLCLRAHDRYARPHPLAAPAPPRPPRVPPLLRRRGQGRQSLTALCFGLISEAPDMRLCAAPSAAGPWRPFLPCDRVQSVRRRRPRPAHARACGKRHRAVRRHLCACPPPLAPSASPHRPTRAGRACLLPATARACAHAPARPLGAPQRPALPMQPPRACTRARLEEQTPFVASAPPWSHARLNLGTSTAVTFPRLSGGSGGTIKGGSSGGDRDLPAAAPQSAPAGGAWRGAPPAYHVAVGRRRPGP